MTQTNSLKVPITLAQLKVDNTSESLLKQIQQICSLYRPKEISKKVCSNILIIKVQEFNKGILQNEYYDYIYEFLNY